jgi:hypothetical protein
MRAHPLVAAHSEALARDGLAVANALDQAVPNDGVLVLACAPKIVLLTMSLHRSQPSEFQPHCHSRPRHASNLSREHRSGRLRLPEVLRKVITSALPDPAWHILGDSSDTYESLFVLASALEAQLLRS